jgi:hypothetical protein
MAQILFAEPARGVFRIVQAASEGRMQAWQFIHVGSSVALTGLDRRMGDPVPEAPTPTREWPPESRLFVALGITVLACGVLSFNYSHVGRLGGMAVVFLRDRRLSTRYRDAAVRIVAAPRKAGFLAAGVGLAILAIGWQTRAIATLEYLRATSLRNQMEWLVMLPDRRTEFADRPMYLRIMRSMIDQGTAPTAPRPTRYPEWVALYDRAAMTAGPIRGDRRRAGLTWMLAAPTLAGALVLTAIDGWRWRDPAIPCSRGRSPIPSRTRSPPTICRRRTGSYARVTIQTT